LAEDVRDLRHATRGHDAVSLITYHSAKGLEWPVVILGNLGFDRDPGMWDPYVTGGGGTPGEDASTGDPLKGRTIHYWPWPFGWTKSSFPTRMSGAGLDEDALESDEGKARVQQSEQEAIRLLYVGVTRAKTKLVFAHRPEKYPWLQQLTEVDRLLDVDQGDGEHEIESVETTFVMRTLDPSMANASRRARSDRATWLESREAGAGEGVPDRYHRPSGATVDGEVGDMRVEHLPGSPCFPSGAKEQHYSAIGQAVHDYLAAIPSLGALTDQQKKQVASRCIAARAVEGFLVADDLVLAGERLVAWVRERFPGAVWYTETPVTAPRMAGGQWTGTVDLLLKLPTGEVVVVDHKSAPIRREKCAAKAAEFAGQLAAYQEVLQQQGVTVQSLWIHFPLAAAMAECPNVAM
jgi:ATP-dependent exoDNAse (exonuclease V) beta subunit